MKHGVPMMGTMALLSVLLGIVFGGFQYGILKIATEFGISKTLMGIMVSVFYGASTVAPLITGSLADRRGKKIVIMGALFLYAAGSAICIFGGNVQLVFIGIMIMGFGTGVLESTYTAALSDYDPPRAGRNVSIIQGTLSIGCCVTPLALEFAAVQWSFGWRALYCLCLVFVFLSTAAVVKTRFADPGSRKGQGYGDVRHGRNRSMGEQQGNEEDGYRFLWKKRSVVLLVLCIFFYMFMENGVTYFADTFISIDLGRGNYTAFALALFWLGMAISRFASGIMYRFEDRILCVGFAAAAAGLLLLFFVHQITAVLAIYFVLGLCFAPIWPFIVGRLNRQFPGDTGKMSAVVLSLGGAGGMLSPYLMGIFADQWSVTSGFLMICGVALLGLVLFLLSLKTCDDDR